MIGRVSETGIDIEVVSTTNQAPSDADVTLLWAAARTTADREAVARAARDADLGYVLDVATRQRVAPLVMRSLEAAGVRIPNGTTAAVQSKLWDAHASLALPSAVAVTLEPLDQAGLKPLALKGLALVDRYPAPGLRPMDDIDLLLPRPLIPAATTVLQRAGWRRVGHRGLDPGYDVVFRNPAVPGVPLELHYELLRWQERTSGLDAQRLWTARVPVNVLGRPAWGLPPELELLALISHAAKRFHLFSRLLWVVDFTISASAPPLDWDRVADLANQTRCRVATAVGLRLAQRLGAEVPDDLLELPPWLVRSGALETLLDPARPFYGRPQRWHTYVLVDDFVGKLRLALGDLARPPSGEPRSRVARHLLRALNRGVPRLARAGLGSRRSLIDR